MSIESPPADKRILNLHECFVNVAAAFVAYAQPPGVLLTAERTLRYPAETPQPFTALNSAPGNACLIIRPGRPLRRFLSSYALTSYALSA